MNQTATAPTDTPSSKAPEAPEAAGLQADPPPIRAGSVTLGLKRVRPYLDGHLVADSRAPLLVWEHHYYPYYGFPRDTIAARLVEAGAGTRSKALGPSVKHDVIIGGSSAPKAATTYPQAPVLAMRNHVVFSWEAMSEWLEEDELVHVHPRSPYVRIDALSSSRRVEVRLGDVVVAESQRPVVLYETGAPPRYYLPRSDVRMDLLSPTTTQSHCPYKGQARYWTVAAGDTEIRDAVWGYDQPLPESVRIAGMVAFWPEKSPELDIRVDGERIGRQ